MSKVVQVERATQNRVINLLQQQLGFTYLGNWEDRDNNSNIEESYLKQYLTDTGKYTETIINKAIFESKKVVALNVNEDLYPINKAFYSLLRYGVKVRE